MGRPARLDHSDERMDQADLDPAVLSRTLTQLDSVNRWLGGTAALLHALDPELRGGVPVTILDVGCGGAGMPRAIVLRASHLHVPHRVTAVERQPQTLSIAVDRSVGSGIDFVRADAISLPFADHAFDVVMMSLTLHHFEGQSRVSVLTELSRVARRRVVINDLERCWPNYFGAKLLAATAWRSNSFARNDGPVSVLRAFTPDELAHDLGAAGLADVIVERRFFYRLVGSGAPRSSPAALSTL